MTTFGIVTFQIGFKRIAFGLPSAGRDVVKPVLDGYAELVSSITG